MPARLKAILFLILSSFFIFTSPAFTSTNLLQNPGFEELLFNWEASSGLEIGSNFTISSYVKNSGECSAVIKHNRTGSYGAQQMIRDIVEGSKYLGKGYAFFNSENAKNARIRIAWYSSGDGSGSQIKTVDSNIIDTPLPSWQELNTGVIEAPTTAKSAKFRILLASSEGVESSVYFDDLFFEEVTSPTPTANPPTPTLIPSPSTAIYKINEVKNKDGNVLSSVKVFVDGVYVHHYAPETLTFCEGCKCDTYVDCDFGQRIIELQKPGYNDWSENKTINASDYFEVNPIMEKEESASSTPTSSPTPTPKAVGVVGTTLSGEILGEEASPEAFYPWQATTEEEGAQEATPSKRRILPFIFLGLGLVFLAAAAYSLWYTKLRWPKEEG